MVQLSGKHKLFRLFSGLGLRIARCKKPVKKRGSRAEKSFVAALNCRPDNALVGIHFAICQTQRVDERVKGCLWRYKVSSPHSWRSGGHHGWRRLSPPNNYISIIIHICAITNLWWFTLLLIYIINTFQTWTKSLMTITDRNATLPPKTSRNILECTPPSRLPLPAADIGVFLFREKWEPSFFVPVSP